MTLQQFLQKHTDFKLVAIGDEIQLEVECWNRNKNITEEEIEDLQEIGWNVNVLGQNMASLCCGDANFRKIR